MSSERYKEPAPGPGQRLNTPLYDRPLRVSATDYVILKRQIAKLRADFAEYLYSISEPIPTEEPK